jgi:exopolyphosphatase/guanosine-5'-triphosphate,3'-diphosphate pyrophosphatase
VGEGDEVLGARSLKLGAIRLTERFHLDQPVKRKTVDEARQFIRSYLAPVQRMVAVHGFEVAIGSSGTIVNLMEMARAAQGDAPLRQVSGAVLHRDALSQVIGVITGCQSLDERLAVPGLDPKRADIVLGGALVLEQAFAVLDIREMVV